MEKANVGINSLPLPTKYDIMVQAKKEMAEINAKLGLPIITPEEEELRESGATREAKRTLMSTRSRYESEQRKYVEEMAGEMRLEVVPQRQYRREVKMAEAFEMFKEQYPKFVKKINGYKITIPNLSFQMEPKAIPMQISKAHAQTIPRAVSIRKPRRRKATMKPKRTKTMRKLNGIKGVKMFSFPDNVWRVRSPRRKKRIRK